MGIGECGTHAIFAVAGGPLSEGERALAGGLVAALKPGMLRLADCGFYSFSRWNRARGSGAVLLWRMKANARLAVERRLPDGSYLTTIYDAEDAGHKDGVSARGRVRDR